MAATCRSAPMHGGSLFKAKRVTDNDDRSGGDSPSFMINEDICSNIPRCLKTKKGPTIISPASGRHSLLDVIVPEMPHYRQELNERGAILLRGFDVSEVKHFDAFVEGVSQQQYRYVYRSTPRTEITNRVSTATNYQARLEIPMHNESAYHMT
nr:TauD/TfdA family dioxygenase [Xanthomonas oryzae]